MSNLTPAMEQYMRIKERYRDCIVLFRMGDFYEMFYDDAKVASRELQIALTSRGKGEKKAPLAGIPYHSAVPYIQKLINKGHKLAVCEQLEDSRFAKGIVKRDIVRIITPGTVIESSLLNDKHNNYVMAINAEKDNYGIAVADISTGEFLTTEFNNYQSLINEISTYMPKELLLPPSLENSEIFREYKNKIFINTFEERHFWISNAIESLKQHFEVSNLIGLGLDNAKLSISCCGALINYLKETQKANISYINKIKKYNIGDYAVIDSITQKNLELLKNIRDNSGKRTLLSVIDKTKTAMGSRLMKKWILRPLINLQEINKRLNSVEELKHNVILMEKLAEALDKVSDIERIIGKIIYGNANPRDIICLKNSLKNSEEIKNLLSSTKSDYLRELCRLDVPNGVVEMIESAITYDPSPYLNQGNIIKEGYNSELDNLKKILRNTRAFISQLEDNERARTGIKSLRISYNKIFGYYIEITKRYLHLVPENYIRKQTQANSERFITSELKEKESLILGAEEKIKNFENYLFNELLKNISIYGKVIQDISIKISILDCLVSFGIASFFYNYNKPLVNEGYKISIENGRHPVIETIPEINFVPNDCLLDKYSSLLIISGPNMSGKSTFMRQAALIVLMAQIGSFVPAKKAEIGIVDKIFTRIGAFDDLASGQSTFMVEMSETANILNNATSKSLIILDEIGRGTSTYDGISLAWATAEYISQQIGAKTLFATHYHQMNKLTDKYANIKNFNVAINEDKDKIIFLYKIVEGATDKSYGIEVAKLAGMPKAVINNAKELMKKLEIEEQLGSRINDEIKDTFPSDNLVTKLKPDEGTFREGKSQEKKILDFL